MCGAGAMSIGEWARMKSYRLARLWLEGYYKRDEAIYHIGYVISRASLKPWCRDLPKDYPYRIKSEEEMEEMPSMSDEETAKRLEEMKTAVIQRAKTLIKEE